jgi:hypothetical protein
VQQSILNRFPSLPIRVYAVWQSAYERDTLDAARQSAQDLFRDDRVRHIWDGDNAIATWYTRKGPLESTAVFIWDAHYLYTSEAQWKDEPSHLIDAWHPVINGMDQLVSMITSLSTDR